MLSGLLPRLLVLSAVEAIAQTLAQDAAVREVVRQYLDARNNADEAKTRALFTADADQLVSTGEWRRGRDNVVSGAMASSRKESGNSRIDVAAVRFITDDVAIVDGDYQTSSPGGSANPRKMRTTFVLKREGGAWKIAAIRNMLPAPASR